MPVINRIAEQTDELTAWRRDLHAHPELLFDLPRTAALVARKLRAFGCDEVVEGVGRSGVVGVIKGRRTDSGVVIGLRADMDALPINEATGLGYASKNAGLMHACGHDGHTAMLLGAARQLCETRNFNGVAVMIFQPAEEGGGGGREMIRDGLMERFAIGQVYGMHCMPGLPVGEFAICEGPIMAAADFLDIEIEGKGGHAAHPDHAVDSNLAAAHVLSALQSVTSRSVDPLASAVVSITSVRSGEDAYNVLPQSVRMKGTVRTLDPAVQARMEPRIRAIVENTAAAFGATGRLDYRPNYPVTVNAPEQTRFAVETAREVAGEGRVDPATARQMGAEDFSFMLNERPGAYIFIGNGDSAGWHHPAFDFNDSALAPGASYWTRLVERGAPI